MGCSSYQLDQDFPINSTFPKTCGFLVARFLFKRLPTPKVFKVSHFSIIRLDLIKNALEVICPELIELNLKDR